MLKKGLSLQGGGVLGAAQAGMLYQGFETDPQFAEQTRPGDVWKTIAGTSIGALNGLMIALGYSAREMIDIWFNAEKEDLVRGRWKKWKSIYTREPMEIFIEKLINKKFDMNDMSFSVLHGLTGVNLICIATIVQTGKPLFMGKDYYNCNVKEAIMMSTAFPLAFDPISYINPIDNEEYQIIDGGTLMNSPILPLVKEQCDDITVLSVGGVPEKFKFTGIMSLKNLFEFITLGNEYISLSWASHFIEDLKIYHCECKNISTFDWGKTKELIKQGISAWDIGPVKIARIENAMKKSGENLLEML